MRGFSLVAASGATLKSRCAGLSLSRPLSLRSTGSRRAGSVIVAYGPSCSAAYGILPDQGANPHPLHWQADSRPLRHQGSPSGSFLISIPYSQLLCHYISSDSHLLCLSWIMTKTLEICPPSPSFHPSEPSLLTGTGVIFLNRSHFVTA